MVDDDDFEMLSKFRWMAFFQGKNKYVVANLPLVHRKQRQIRMHRLLMGFPKNKVIDHIDMDGFNNQKLNLRICNQSQNLMNRGKPSAWVNNPMRSIYKCVYWENTRKKWSVQLRIEGKMKRFGFFSCERKAGLTANEMIKKYHGDFSNLNTIKEDLSNFTI